MSEEIHQGFTARHAYSVGFTRNLFDPANSLLPDLLGSTEPVRHRLLFFIDEGVDRAFPDLSLRIRRFCQFHKGLIDRIAEPMVLPGGEACKDGLTVADRMLRVFAGSGADRHTFVVAIGGGAFIDMAGLATTLCHRGLRFIRVPTTVLAQNDAGIGVKNGVNYLGQKNFLGTFQVPTAVINDYDFISGLEERDKRAGIAEAIKVGLFKDPEFFQWLIDHRFELAAFEEDAMQYMIHRCAALHVEHIGRGGDPFESGNKRPLDLGHWAAHRLEILSNYRLRHGEAVATGLALDLAYSVARFGLDRRVLDDYETLATDLGFELWQPELLARKDRRWLIFDGLEQFREHLGGELAVPMVRRPGDCLSTNHIDQDLYLKLIRQLAEPRPVRPPVRLLARNMRNEDRL